jgi:hypothetical protein
MKKLVSQEAEQSRVEMEMQKRRDRIEHWRASKKVLQLDFHSSGIFDFRYCVINKR